MRERRIVGMAAACAAWLAATSAHAEVVSLAALEQHAIQKHARLTAGALRVRAAQAEVREAASTFRPRAGLSVEASAAPGRILQKLDGPDIYVQGAPALEGGSASRALAPRPRVGTGVEFDAYLYDFGRTESAVQAGSAKRRAAEAENELTRAEVIGSVRGAYLAWLSAHQLHQLAITASSDAARRKERVSALIEEGVRPRTDLPPVDADRLLSELERERADGDLASARLTLEQRVGESLPDDAEPDLEVLRSELPTRRGAEPDPALKVMAHQRSALEATARLQRKQRRPLLTTSLGAGVYTQLTNSNSSGREFKPFPTYSVGVGLTVPLWDGGGSKAAAEAAEANAAELGVRLESAERERSQELERARLDVANAERRRELAEQLIQICKTRVADAEAGYELGAMQFDQVQQARALLRRAETEVVMAKVSRTQAVLRVSP